MWDWRRTPRTITALPPCRYWYMAMRSVHLQRDSHHLAGFLGLSGFIAQRVLIVTLKVFSVRGAFAPVSLLALLGSIGAPHPPKGRSLRGEKENLMNRQMKRWLTGGTWMGAAAL